jgi:hypothetical protein
MFQSVLERQVAAAEDAVRAAVAAIDPDDIPASEAVRLFERLDRIVRSATAGRTLLARRVEDSQVWQRKGHRSAAEHVAAVTGTSLGAAKGEMETSKALRDLPRTRRKMVDGSISPQQGSLIAGAAKVNPQAERDLLERAGTANLHELRDDALKAKAAADRSPADTHARLRRQRRLSRFTDAEGARHLNLIGPVDQVSVIEAEIDRRLSQVIRDHPAGKPLECRDALAFDAAVTMARRSEAADDTPATKTKRRKVTRPHHLALLRLDVEALRRGHVEGHELCEVTGLGPIPVEVARRLLGDAVLKLIITKGDAVAHVTSLTRGPTQAMQYASLWTSPTCTVEGCSRTIVEYDHRTGAEYKDTRHTRLDEIDRVCHTHHDLHTHHGWALVAGAGKRPMVPPDDARHPAHGPPSGARAGPASAALTDGEPPPTDDPPTSGSSPPDAVGRERSTGQRDLFSDPAA